MGDGASTDMTAALLVMESMLTVRAPEEPAASRSGRRPRDIPLHGNYKQYYGYRWGPCGGEDPRLQVPARSIFNRQSRACAPDMV